MFLIPDALLYRNTKVVESMTLTTRYRQFWMSKIGITYMVSNIHLGITLALTESVETVYLLGRGFAFVQVGMIWSTLLVTTALLDFPTGNMADKLGRRNVYCVGLLASAVGYLIYSLSYEYHFFLAGAFCIGVGNAQVSGSLGAWLIDEKKKRGEDSKVAKTFGDTKLAVSAAGIVAGFLVGSFYTGPLSGLFFLSGSITALAAVWVWLSLRENYGESRMKWVDFQKTTVNHFFREKMLLMASLIMVLIFSCYTVFVFVYQPAAVASGIREQQLGTLFSLYLISSGVGSFIFGRLSSRLSFRVLMGLSFTGFGCGFVLFSVCNIYVIALGLVVFSFGFGGYLPVFLAWTSKFIPSEIRSSTMSLMSTVGRGSVFLLQPAIGKMIDLFSAKAALTLGECFVIGGIVVLLLMGGENHDSQVV